MGADQVRQAYAARVDEYVALLGSVADMPREDRDLIAAWSRELEGPVLDAGCGPGHWTEFLHRHGVAVEGVDLTPEFVASARQRFPDVPFRIGDLDDLCVPDGSLTGILSWFSVIHTEPGHVAAHLAEFARCIRPGGSLLLGFFEGETLAPFDHAVVTAYYWPVDAMRDALARAGFEVLETQKRTAGSGRRAYAAMITRRVGRPEGSSEPSAFLSDPSA